MFRKLLFLFFATHLTLFTAESINANELVMTVPAESSEVVDGAVSIARFKIVLERGEGFDPSKYECIQLVAEDVRSGFFWVQVSPPTHRLPISFDWAVSSTSTLPLIFYFVGGQQEHCAEFEKVLPPNDIVPLGGEYSKIMPDITLTRECQFHTFESLTLGWYGEQEPNGCQ